MTLSFSPRDKGDHGPRTASTAAGSFVENTNCKGLASGVARGGAPLAHQPLDRAFPTAITLANNRTLMGQSLDTGGKQKHRFTGLVYSERIALDPNDDSALDFHVFSLSFILLPPHTYKQNTIYAAVAVHQAGGIGLIYVQYDNNLLESCDVFPCIRVDCELGTQILSYIRKARSGDAERAGYALLYGSSMACPHVSGIVALIKSEHPNWSPAAIRSALVTTASQKGTDGMDITEVGPTSKVVDQFDIGGGHVNPNRAVNPGLIYNISTEDNIQFLCSMGYSNLSITRLTQKTTRCTKNSHFMQTLNLPSITIPNFKKTATVLRVVTNVEDINSNYEVLGVLMVVESQLLCFNSTTRVLPFKAKFFSTQKMHGDYRFGRLIWTDGKHIVRSPVSIRVM
ncbi:subtilase 1.3 [Actinidia rufa]|uniref:Subtilase 1.3 n=1 Tax=Actinidia rufa TaxID=165716 RepID=A0A7J0DYW4_9ERIC|nr:subtilase 1.3 [Actinidia rufa]